MRGLLNRNLGGRGGKCGAGLTPRLATMPAAGMVTPSSPAGGASPSPGAGGGSNSSPGAGGGSNSSPGAGGGSSSSPGAGGGSSKQIICWVRTKSGILHGRVGDGGAGQVYLCSPRRKCAASLRRGESVSLEAARACTGADWHDVCAEVLLGGPRLLLGRRRTTDGEAVLTRRQGSADH